MEFRFELALCAALERPDRVLARQLGGAVAEPGARIADVCLLERGPGFERRAAISPETIPPAAIEADVGPGRAVPVREAFDLRPERANAAIDAAVQAGYLERERRDGTPCVRTTARYPDDWVGRLVAIENKPDLGRPGDLAAQLRFDVALGLFDEVWLATASYVTGAHRNRIPDPVGILRFDPDTGERETVREPTPLTVDEPGVEIRAETPARTDVALVSAEEKARKRRRIAERAYGKGWRPDPPACAHASVTGDGRPRCDVFDRVVDPGSDCGSACDAFDPADPPRLDRERFRENRSAWMGGSRAGPRRQSGLDRFG